MWQAKDLSGGSRSFAAAHGLGLSMVRAVAALHELTARIEDNQPGARFIWTRAD